MKTGVSTDALVQVSFLGMCFIIFGVFIHDDSHLWFISMAAVLLASVYTAVKTDTWENLRLKFGMTSGIKPALYNSLGIVLGITIGFLYRSHLQLPIIPPTLGSFVFVAQLIGATEELIFRGYLQGIFKHQSIVAIVIPTLFHTLYKVSIFISSDQANTIRFGFLFFWTLSIGLLFALLRARSKSVIPAVLGHTIFDILVYGQLTAAPWWVW